MLIVTVSPAGPGAAFRDSLNLQARHDAITASLSAELSVAFAVLEARDRAQATRKLDSVRFLRWAGTPAEALWVPGDFVLIAWAPENNPAFRALETLTESEFLRRLAAPTGR